MTINIETLRFEIQLNKLDNSQMVLSPLVVGELLDRLEAAEKDAAELEARCATLADALRSTAQALAWMQHGKCRGFSDDLLTTNEALEKARAALEESK